MNPAPPVPPGVHDWTAQQTLHAFMEKVGRTLSLHTLDRLGSVSLKPDLELVRAVMFAAEADNPVFFERLSEREGCNEVLVAYHVDLLREEGLLTVEDAKGLRGKGPYPESISITPAGRDFVERARDQTGWRTAVLATANQSQNWSIRFLVEVLKPSRWTSPPRRTPSTSP
jgi:hypothetical protein